MMSTDEKQDVDVRPKPKPAPGKMYFSAETQDAIVLFRKTECFNDREKLYRNEILPAFSKLVENLIFMYGFAGRESYDTMKSDCITFLYEKLHRFDEARGPKAFSYFNVVAKRWLIIRSQSNAASQRRNISIDDALSPKTDRPILDNTGYIDEPERQLTKNESIGNVMNLMLAIKAKLTSQHEIKCIDAIISLFANADNIDMLNKRAVFICLRELSGLEQKKMTVAMSTIRRHYSDMSRSDEFSLF